MQEKLQSINTASKNNLRGGLNELSKKLFKLKMIYTFVITLTLFLSVGLTTSFATHFRYGNISWRTVPGSGGKTIEFKVSQAWRYTAFFPTAGGTAFTDYLYFGDGTDSEVHLNVTTINTVEDWFYGETTITHTYASNGTYLVNTTSCCRISTLQNNADGSYDVQTSVQVGPGNNSPVVTLPPIVNLASNTTGAFFTIPVTDPDGDDLSFRLANSAEMGEGVNPTGLSVNATTGVVTWSTTGTSTGDLYNAAITITDKEGAKVTVDFLIKITEEGEGNPPVFDYGVSPNDKTIFQVPPDQAVNFTMKASDDDDGDVVTLQALGLPPGSALTPALPVTGNPVQTSFSWTPTSADMGTSVITFVAQDIQGNQTTTSVTIIVSLKPVFDVPPTPAANSYVFVSTGSSFSQVIQASDPDPADKVKIISATGLPAGVTFTPALPSSAGNPTSTTLKWTPQASQYGVNTATFTAEDTYDEQTTHIINFVVNTQPAFTSVPVTSIGVGQAYTYNIILTDPDLKYGDQITILAASLPDWLTLTDNGDGTATLSGTPTNTGNFTINLSGEDVYHHATGTVTQSFTINVTSGPNPGCTASGTILREQWDNVKGRSITDIPLLRSPSSTSQLTLFEAPINIADNYAARIRGYICPPQTGNYTFYIAGDDGSELWLSTDDDPVNKVKVAFVNGYTRSRQWNKYADQTSAPIMLQANKRYYIEALHKEELRNDNLAVGWKLPNGTIEAPIAGTRLSPYQATQACTASGTILREQWDNVKGRSITDIPLLTTPSSTSQLTVFEIQTNLADNYGDRIRGYICPPQSDYYTFYIAGDDKAELWLSTDDDPGNKVRIASVDGYTSFRQWNKYPSQKSVPVLLKAGHRYYVEALHKEELLNDNLSVGWQLQNNRMIVPISGAWLSPYEPDGSNAPRIAVRPEMSRKAVDLINKKGNGHQVNIYPNPSKANTTIEFSLDEEGEIMLQVYSLQGALLKTLHNGKAAAKKLYQYEFDGSNYASGVYICRLTTKGKVAYKRIVLEK